MISSLLPHAVPYAHMSVVAVALVITAASVAPSAAETSAVGVERLEVVPERSSDGVYQLRWTASGPVRLEESKAPDFADARTVYEGRDRATTLTGRPDGTYYYRALDRSGDRATGPTTAPSVVVEVAHHSLARAVGFFGVGLVVFGATVALVLRGERGAADA